MHHLYPLDALLGSLKHRYTHASCALSFFGHLPSGPFSNLVPTLVTHPQKKDSERCSAHMAMFSSELSEDPERCFFAALTLVPAFLEVVALSLEVAAAPVAVTSSRPASNA